MNALLKTYAAKGLGLERLLEALRKQGIPLYDVRREGPRRLSFSCPMQLSKQAEDAADRLGFTLEPLPPRGWLYRLLRVKARLPLAAAALFAALTVALAMQFVWRMEIIGAGVYAGEVRTLLREQEIGPGVFRAAVDTRALCEALLDRLPRVAWVRVRVSGVTLVIDVTQGVPSPALESTGNSGDIVADRDGVIRHIDVYSGTAAVRTGQTVRKGDLLIRGEEKSSLDGATVPVRARGNITADEWVQASAAVSLLEIQSVPTGNSATQTLLGTPWGSLALTPEPDYLTCDTETVRVPLGGAWFPLWIEHATYSEVALEAIPRDISAVQAEAGTLALQKLLILCGGSDEMIDNWLDFSMIEGDTVIAAATALVRRQVGVFVPHTSQ
ncbi:MAG: sporulation protein YqfD [Clostridia bacterium]|nr:sporulation protein YqfD [Clostridia bacterium]